MAAKGRKKKGRGQGSAAPHSKGRGAGGEPRWEGGAASLGVPLWLVFVVFGGVTLFLFRDFLVGDDLLFGVDTLSLGYAARHFYAEALREGIFPFWNPLILGGTPFVESLAGGDSLYPTSLLLLVTETHRALGWKLVIHVFVAGLVMYGWTRALGRSRPAALLSGLAYMLAPFLVTLVYPGHDGKLFVTALTPLLFWVTERAWTDRGLFGYLTVAAVVGLVLLTTHFQAAYFLFGGVGLYAGFRAVQTWRRGGEGQEDGGESEEPGVVAPGGGGPRPALTRFGLFLAAALLGAGVAAVQFVPAVEYVTEHSRRTATTTQAEAAGGVAYSSSWSLHPEEVAALVVPEFVGSNVGGADWASDTYWGRNPFKLNHEYAGIVVLLLAGLAFFGAPRRGLRWFLVGLGLLSLLYALGAHTPVWRIFYEVVPGVSLFRAPSVAIFLFGFSAATLMAFGVDRGVELARGDEAEWRPAWRYLWISTAVLGAATLLASAGALTSAWTAVVYPDVAPNASQALERARPFIVRGVFVVTVLVGAVTLLFWMLRRRFLPLAAVVAGLAVLVAVDQIRVDDPFIQTVEMEQVFSATQNHRFLVERTDQEPPFRVFSMMGGNGQDVKPAIWGIELAAGHHPNDLARYRELIGMRGSTLGPNLGNLSNPAVLQILNVRYLLWPGPGRLPGAEPVSTVTYADGTVHSAVYPYPGLPRARLVGRAVVREGREAVHYILGDAFEPATEVVLSEPPPVELPGRSVLGSVTWEERTPNRLRWTVEAEEPALLVVAENWFPGWTATVDGEEAPVLRANHTLRAVPVPPGRHAVEMAYDSSLLTASFAVSVALALFLVVAGAVTYRRERRPSGASGARG